MSRVHRAPLSKNMKSTPNDYSLRCTTCGKGHGPPLTDLKGDIPFVRCEACITSGRINSRARIATYVNRRKGTPVESLEKFR